MSYQNYECLKVLHRLVEMHDEGMLTDAEWSDARRVLDEARRGHHDDGLDMQAELFGALMEGGAQ